ncbi:ferritin-like domain-containing protein [Haloarculaceae archaeon H-GB2-1]|nr:ferritin-like domain-containing protein [Haloarculaceae archaeon H-GB1-1]MEA5387571.1 ferritin-like domain-containing protein [Haloarculaceae archaeon H-GB11]MEA5409055.1 ferritin-like domain-containing protein [Haloarculaceae archaeon H-GB2-1]
MSLTQPVSSDHQLARLLQIGVVLEEVVEARAAKHAEETAEFDDELRTFMREAAEESSEHRERLEALVDELDADTVPFEDIKLLVEERYEAESDFDGVLYDQLCNEETAYKFYDDLIVALAESDADFGIERERLVSVLTEIRDEEAEGVEEVTQLMEARE